MQTLTVIYSPPGSGKTKTIVAIVGAHLTNSLGQQGVPIAKPSVPTNGPKQIGGKPNANDSPPPKKLLICAPSNAAVDELVMRLKTGIRTLTGKAHKINVVRIGRSDAMNSEVKDVSLDTLVEKKLNMASNDKEKDSKDIHGLMMDHKQTSDAFIAIRNKIDEFRAQGKPIPREDEREIELLKRKKTSLSQAIDAARDSRNTEARDAGIFRNQIQQEILDGAHVICGTLSGTGHELFQHLKIEFETVIIDEAAQSIELSALIPLKYGCSKCILVGDPKQLPPTVFSKEAARFQYEQSLFVRMQKNHPKDVHLLDTQYRMHPEISDFPSKRFYESRLKDGLGMAKLRMRPWHQHPTLGPYRFFDVRGMNRNNPGGHSLINDAEIDMAIRLYDRLITDCSDYDFHGKVGVITPYKAQIGELSRRFTQKYGATITSKVEFNTTDAFQGRESEVIIFSCVRASSARGVGFLADIRRMNVGITRAKSSLWILGNSQSLQQGEFWNYLIQDARDRDRYTVADQDLQRTLARRMVDGKSMPQEGMYHNGHDVSEVSTPAAEIKPEVDADGDVEMKDSVSSNGGKDVQTGGTGKRKRETPSSSSSSRRASEISDSHSSDRTSAPPPPQQPKTKVVKVERKAPGTGLSLHERYGPKPITTSAKQPAIKKEIKQEEDSRVPKLDPDLLKLQPATGTPDPVEATKTDSETANKAAMNGGGGTGEVKKRPMAGVPPPRKKKEVDPFIRRKPGSVRR